MFIGIVCGAVVASQQTNSMQGLPLRLVRKVSPSGEITDSYTVAVDALGSDTGEYVLIGSGSTARQTVLTDGKPVDAIIMAIVDMWQIQGQLQYTKQAEG